MAKYPIYLAAGGTREVEGRKFAYYVQNIREWFIVHKEGNVYTVSDWASGMRVCDVPYMAMIAALSDEVLAAKGALKDKIAQVGEARFASVLRGAKPIREAKHA